MFGRSIPIHVIDFEGAPSYGVVEYGIATLHGGKITQTKTRLCRAFAPIDFHDVAVHGITYEESLAYEPFEKDYDVFVELRRTGPLAAHNARYEERLVKQVWAIPPMVPDFLSFGSGPSASSSGSAQGLRPGCESDKATWGPWIDSCALARKLAPGLSRYKLQAVVEELGLQNELDAIALDKCPENRRMYHAALYDAVASALILKYLLCKEGFVQPPLEKLFSVKG